MFIALRTAWFFPGAIFIIQRNTYSLEPVIQPDMVYLVGFVPCWLTG